MVTDREIDLVEKEVLLDDPAFLNALVGRRLSYDDAPDEIFPNDCITPALLHISDKTYNPESEAFGKEVSGCLVYDPFEGSIVMPNLFNVGTRNKVTRVRPNLDHGNFLLADAHTHAPLESGLPEAYPSNEDIQGAFVLQTPIDIVVTDDTAVLTLFTKESNEIWYLGDAFWRRVFDASHKAYMHLNVRDPNFKIKSALASIGVFDRHFRQVFYVNTNIKDPTSSFKRIKRANR